MSETSREEPVIAGRAPIVLDMEPGTYYWCACGRSAKQPFCDGSHKVTAFQPIEVRFAEKRTITWCVCKHSKNKPYCDGTHSVL